MCKQCASIFLINTLVLSINVQSISAYTFTLNYKKISHFVSVFNLDKARSLWKDLTSSIKMATDILRHTWRGKKIDVKDKSDKELELSDFALKTARKELREDRSARNQCLEQLLNWLNKNEDVENIRTDDRFLLRFLRAKKFSVPMTQQIILKYLNLKRVFPQMTTNLDFKNKSVHEIMTNGYLTVSPVRDQHGRRVIIVRACK